MTQATPAAPGPADLLQMRQDILRLVEAYMDAKTAPGAFEPGKSAVPYSGTWARGAEYRAFVDSTLSGWFGLGAAGAKFEERTAAALGRKRGLFVNSGSSANLLAVSALASPKVPGALQQGDEVVTCVSGFPTTLNPLLQTGMRVRFVDTSLPTYNPTADMLAQAITPQTKALVFAHTLGNPYDMRAVADLAEDHGLWVMEDCCDALGSTYRGAPCGSFGDVATCSFYPAHHITTGEGGLVAADDTRIMRAAESLRDWGRDCWCPPGVDDSCGKRFNWQLGSLPLGYDHKYTYGEVGYNLKPLEMQAAFGLVQLDRLPEVSAARRRNFRILTEGLASVADSLVLPQATPGSDPSWFAFPMTLGDGIDRRRFIAHLTERRIATRMLFGSNLLRQPAYAGLGLDDPGRFPAADRVMERTLFVGTSPVVSEPAARHMAAAIVEAVAAATAR